MCTRTVFAKAELVLWRTAPETFRLEVARSFVRYVVDMLSEIARDTPA
jgi:sarcosine oxidase subunit gamma